MMRTISALVVLAVSATTFAATFGDYESVGFLSDYSKIRPRAGDETFSWSEPPPDIAVYHKIIVDRIKIY